MNTEYLVFSVLSFSKVSFTSQILLLTLLKDHFDFIGFTASTTILLKQVTSQRCHQAWRNLSTFENCSKSATTLSAETVFKSTLNLDLSFPALVIHLLASISNEVIINMQQFTYTMAAM